MSTLTTTLLAAFVVGLFSTVHCVGMCGGIAGTLAYSLPPAIRVQRPRLAGYLLAYNGGRILSYALVGATLGALGSGLTALLPEGSAHRVLQGVAALLMTGIGLYIAGWFPRFALIERIGIPLWRRLEPLGRRLLPVQSPLAALLYGLIWGWLPCGLVYTMALWTLASDSSREGMLMMIAFGVGTLPAVAGTGMLAVRLGRVTRHDYVRKLAGSLLIALALAGLLAADWLHRTLPAPLDGQVMQCKDERI